VLRGLCGPVVVAAALAAVGCSDDLVTDPGDTTPPTQVTETYSGTLTVNGAVTHPFIVQTAGNVVATVTALDPVDDDTAIGLSMGTWNGIACTIGAPTLANDGAKVGVSLTASATVTGNYCVRVYDVGKIKQATAFELTVVHF
jgi:hypothetical protein